MIEASVDCGVNGESVPKKRKVRKGTQSCWECKRRKTRCTFRAPTESVCDGCRSRRVSCISQEFDDEPRKKPGLTASNSDANQIDLSKSPFEDPTQRFVAKVSNSMPNGDQGGREILTTSSASENKQISSEGKNYSSCIVNNIATVAANVHSGLEAQAMNQRPHNKLCNALLTVWPSSNEIEIITSVSIGMSTLFHGTICVPYANFLGKAMPTSRELLQRPAQNLHPVLIAYKLLMLGSILQSIPRETAKILTNSGIDYHELRAKIVETASRLVTSNDDFIDSLEGIECLMVESMYQNNAGNLRRAWRLNRRAMIAAQMMGIHRNNSSTLRTPNLLDGKNGERINPEFMWLRLVMSDRYLSLMLGLPQGSQDDPFVSEKALEACSPLERLERHEAMIGGLIIRRNKQDLRDLNITFDIDRRLQAAASLMPAQWWLPPNNDVAEGKDAEAFSEDIRLVNQFAHYHLLAQLHLPCLLYFSNDPKYDYSKVTAVNASREIISRFVGLHESKNIGTYCRGIDFLAFIASTTLCLAHVHNHADIHVRQQSCAATSTYSSVLRSLTHQRLADRGLLERTLESLENMARDENDIIAGKIAAILQRLLVVEQTAAQGTRFTANLLPDRPEQELLHDSEIEGAKSVLSVSIPHLGTITIEAGPSAHSQDHPQAPVELMSAPTPTPMMTPKISRPTINSDSQAYSDARELRNQHRYEHQQESNQKPEQQNISHTNIQSSFTAPSKIIREPESHHTATDRASFSRNDKCIMTDKPQVTEPLFEAEFIPADMNGHERQLENEHVYDQLDATGFELTLQGVDAALFANLFDFDTHDGDLSPSSFTF